MPYNYYYTEDPAPSIKTENLQIEHRGFMITMDHQYCLYSIHSPIGTELDRRLEGSFTKVELAKSVIDEYLKDHNLSEAFVVKETEHKVGRPTGKELRERKQVELEQKIAALLKEHKELA